MITLCVRFVEFHKGYFVIKKSGITKYYIPIKRNRPILAFFSIVKMIQFSFFIGTEQLIFTIPANESTLFSVQQ